MAAVREMRLGLPAAVAAAAETVPPDPDQQHAVNCRKPTTLHSLVDVAASEFRQEVTMSQPLPATPVEQSAGADKKTFTRSLRDTLRSHPSCIGARVVPFINGAADVSGR